MAEPRTRAELLAELNRLLAESRARPVQGMPALRSLGQAIERVRTLLQIIESIEIERYRQAAEVRTLKAALATALKAYAQAADKLRAPRPADASEESWPK